MTYCDDVFVARRATRTGALVLALLAGAVVPAVQADPYPEREVRLLAGFPPGSSSDTLSRILAENLSRSLGQPVIVENRAGALSTLSAQAVARAKPDGYTLTVAANSAMSSAPAGLMQVSYDPVADFTPLGGVATLEFVLVANNDLPVSNLAELLEHGKGPKPLSCASGNASALLSCSVFEDHAGIPMVRVPYNSPPQAATDVIGGHVPMMFLDVPTAAPHVRGGRLRAIAVASGGRHPLLPDVPTFAEQGMADMPTVTGWTALYGPAGLPPAVAARLAGELRQAIADPEFRKRLGPIGWTPAYLPPDDIDRFLKQDLKFWRDSIEKYGLKPAS